MKTFYKSALAIASLSMLAACGGGGEIGNDIVSVSIGQPSGVLEGGKIITIKGTAQSKSGKLTSMGWTVANSGASGSAPTITNDTCASSTKTDSSFGSGSSTWDCVLTLVAPKTISADTTYNLNLSASSASFSGRTSSNVVVKPATKEANPIQVSFSPLSSVNRAGELIRITGTVSSTKSLLTGAQWTLIGGSNVNTTATPSSLTPVIENADCAEKVQSNNVSGVESSLLTCTARLLVPAKLPATTNYTLALVGTNADGYSLSNSLTIPVQQAAQVSNKVAIAMGPAPTTTLSADKVTVRAEATSTGSLLKASDSAFVVTNVTPNQPLVGTGLTVPAILTLANGSMGVPVCTTSDNPSGAGSSRLNCSSEFVVPSIPVPVTYTVSFNAVDDEGYSAIGTVDITAQPRTDVFGLRADVSATPDSIVGPGSNVTMTCSGAGAPAGTTYSYLWRVTNSNGLLIPLNTSNIANGVVTFTAPSVDATTSVELECLVSANNQVANQAAPITIFVPAAP